VLRARCFAVRCCCKLWSVGASSTVVIQSFITTYARDSASAAAADDADVDLIESATRRRRLYCVISSMTVYKGPCLI